MTDYTRDIGGGTTLMIRHYEEYHFDFFVKTGASTYNRAQQWEYELGGTTHHATFNLQRGGNWQLLGTAPGGGDIGGDFDVRLTIFNSGLGFPTYNFVQHISLVGPPAPPFPPYVFAVNDTAIDFGWGGDGGPGGASITGREFWWSNDGVPRNLISNGGARNLLTGLYPGAFYNLWARNANYVAWSGFSAPTLVRMLRIPDAPTPVTFNNVGLNYLETTFTYDGKWDGGTPVREWQMGYGLDPNAPQVFVGGVQVPIGNLNPGRLYYFWARGRNDIGWSPWSARSQVQLHAGSYVKVGGAWTHALVWVKVAGVWRLTKPWTKAGGTWRRTS